MVSNRIENTKLKISFSNSMSLRSEDNVEVDTQCYSQSNFNKSKSKEKYTINYRIIKTLLLILTWISFGLNFELIGSTMEDLKIYLDVNYSKYSFGLVLRNIGYLTITLVLGFVLDKLNNFTDILMMISSLIIGITSFLTPITRNYKLAMSYYLAQGISQSIYDLTGNVIILSLWSEINASPLNSVHGGYGIGAMLATQLAKPFIKFHPIETTTSNFKLNNKTSSQLKILKFENSSSQLNRSRNNILNGDSIELRAPYWIAGSMSILIALLFIICQLYESKNRHKFENKQRQFILLNEDSDLETKSIDHHEDDNDEDHFNRCSLVNKTIQKLLFADKMYEGKSLAYMLTQITLFILMFIMTQGSFTIISRFMLTYLTKGPANLSIQIYSIIFSLFWGLFIFSRFFSTYLSVKFDPIIFFTTLLIFNSVICALFLIPFLTKYEIFYWIFVPLLGMSSGPLMPCGLMIAKQILDFNSLVLSLFIVGMATGGIICQQLTGEFLDHFRPGPVWMGFNHPSSAYSIPHLIFITSFFSLICFLPIYFLYKYCNQANFYKISQRFGI